MAQPTNTYDAYDAGTANLTGGANREDLSDIIYDVSPVETPFLTLAQRATATNARHEWLIDALLAPNSNRQIEGDDYTIGTTPVSAEARNAPARAFTATQISAKALVVTGTQEVVQKAGRKSELAYQLMRQAKELKRDIERHCVGFMTTADATAIGGGTAAGDGFPILLGSATAARSTANLPSWIATNANIGAGVVRGHVGSGTVLAATTGFFNAASANARALLESTLKEVIRGAWNEGGNPTTIIVDAFNKQVISSFTGGTTKFDQTEDKRLVTAIDVYVSDFGDHTVYPDRFILNPNQATAGVSAYVLDMQYWAIAYLRPFMQTELGKSGDNEKRLILAEWCLESRNERASGMVSNLTNS